MEGAASRGGRQVTKEVGSNVVQLFRTIENPIAGLRRHFEQLVTSTEKPRRAIQELGKEHQTLSDKIDRILMGPNAPRAQWQQTEEQIRKTGERVKSTTEDVARSTGQATTSMRAFGVAGLAAFAAYEVLSRSLRAVSGVAGNVFQTGLFASAAGTNITEFASAGLALEHLGNVPRAQTQEWLANYVVMQRQAQLGQSPGTEAYYQLQDALSQGALTAGIGGFGINPLHDTWQQYASKLAQGFAASPNESWAIAAGQSFGLDMQQVLALRRAGQLPGGLEREMAASAALAPNKEQQSLTQRYIEAMNRLSQAFDSFVNSVVLTRLIDILTGFVDHLNYILQGAPGGEGEPGGAVGPNTPGIQGFLYRIFSGGGESFEEFRKRVHPGEAPGSGRTGALSAPLASGNQYAETINKAARQHGVPPQLLYDLMEAESGGDPKAVSSAGAKGLMQFMPGTAAKYGVDVTDPTSSIFGAAHYLSDLYNKTGSWTAALGEYSGQGPGLGQYAAQSGHYGPDLVRMAHEYDAGKSATPSSVASSADPVGYAADASKKAAIAAGSNIWDWAKQHDPLHALTGGAETDKWQGSLIPTTNQLEPFLIPGTDTRLIQQHAALGGTTNHTHNYGDFVMNGDVVVNAPTREGDQIAATVREQMRSLPPRAYSADQGLA